MPAPARPSSTHCRVRCREPAGRARRGFSLVEVLVAVAVLAIGLLAIAKLQSALIRSSGEARAYSVATGLAKDKLEELRSFDATQGVGRTYRSLTDGSESLGVIGGAEYTRGWTVTRYIFNKDPDHDPTTYDGAFVEFADDTGEVPTAYVGNTASGFVEGNEFKRITVSVVWNGPSGNTEAVTIQDAVAAIAPRDSALIAEGGSAVIPRSLEVMISDPTRTNGVANGVIPLALSSDASVDDGSTAATNPQPLLLGADYRVAETRFNVLTYGAVVDGVAPAQSRVETIVVGCTCSYALADASVRGYRPSYWNGYRYTVPQRAAYTQPAGWTGAPNESEQCATCCRDHHDEVAGASVVPQNGPRFDPRRTRHVHYAHDSAGALVAATGASSYEEACRLIRVDGVYRVTSDAFTDRINLLETRNDDSTTPFVPADQAISNYQRFALAYLDQRVVNNGAPTTFNDPLSDSTLATIEDPQPPSTPSRSINVPAVLSIDNNQQRWMHLRGLYMDYLEPGVVSSILAAKANCAMDTGPGGCAGSPAKKESAVLRLLPFTSINLTEIGDWKPAKPSEPGGQDILVYNNLLKCSVPAADGGPATGCQAVVNGATVPIDPARPVRGLTQKIVQSATAGNRPVVTATADRSNSRLAVMTRPIDPDEGAPLLDTQVVQIAGGSGGGTSAAAYFVAIDGYPLSAGAQPVIDTSPSAGYVYATSPTPGFQPPNPATLTPNPVVFGEAVKLLLRNYNFRLSTFGPASSANCTGPSGTKVLSPASTNTNFLLYAQATCKNYAVTGASVNGAAVAGAPWPVASVRTPGTPEGSLTEYTTIMLPVVNRNDLVRLTLAAQPDQFPPPTCTYTASDLTGSGGWKGSATPIVTPGQCPP
jgi:prepilin-type N-terminal cleavage/methylation domain-containing protein